MFDFKANVGWRAAAMKKGSQKMTARFHFYLGERKIYQMKKLIHYLIGTMFAVPLCCDFIIPHQY